jgi:hypothetical protein
MAALTDAMRQDSKSPKPRRARQLTIEATIQLRPPPMVVSLPRRCAGSSPARTLSSRARLRAHPRLGARLTAHATDPHEPLAARKHQIAMVNRHYRKMRYHSVYVASIVSRRAGLTDPMCDLAKPPITASLSHRCGCAFGPGERYEAGVTWVRYLAAGGVTAPDQPSPMVAPGGRTTT